MLGAYKFQSLRSVAKQVAIKSVLGAIDVLKLGRLMPAQGGRGIIFTLHHVRPARSYAFCPNAHLSITPEFLDKAIAEAKRAGLVPVHLGDLPTLLADPNDTRKFVSFTLDDGYRNNLEYAAPVFRKHGAPFTVFVTPGFVDRSRTMWWETLEALVRKADSFNFDFGQGPKRITCRSTDSKTTVFERVAEFVQTSEEDAAIEQIDRIAIEQGVDPVKIVENEIMSHAELDLLLIDPLASLGAHTMTHPNLARVCVERLWEEMRRSAEIVSGYAGRRVTTFSYPYGADWAVSERETRTARELGFDVAVTTQPGVLRAESLGAPTAFRRVSLNGYYQKPGYVRALISGLAFRTA
jgi:peptidoglycan/xylan/chitin deacetylase (PgdA/CDA1 family)